MWSLILVKSSRGATLSVASTKLHSSAAEFKWSRSQFDILRGGFLCIDMSPWGGISSFDQDQGMYGVPPINRNGIFSSRILIAPVIGVNNSSCRVFDSIDSSISVARARRGIGTRLNCNGLFILGDIFRLCSVSAFVSLMERWGGSCSFRIYCRRSGGCEPFNCTVLSS